MYLLRPSRVTERVADAGRCVRNPPSASAEDDPRGNVVNHPDSRRKVSIGGDLMPRGIEHRFETC